jgi:transcriptional regulator with XRE-family HTH domain
MAKRSMFEGWSDARRAALAARIREMVEQFDTVADAAKHAGISLSALEGYISGRSAPSAIPLAELALKTGYDLQWVMTGTGEKRRSPEVQANIDETVRVWGLARELIDGWRDVYGEAGIQLSKDKMDESAGDTLDAVTEFTSSHDERRRLVAFALDLERRRLRRQ